jgi:hypothetical protein
VGLKNFLGFLLIIPISIDEKALTSPLAFITNRFAVLFDYVPLAVTWNTDHFGLPVSSTYGSIKRVALTALAYTPVLCGWQGKY